MRTDSTVTATTTAPPQRRLRLLPLLASLGTLLKSIPLIVTGSWLAWRSTHADCMGFLHIPLIILGCLLFLTSILGIMAALRGSSQLHRLYAFLTALIFLTLLGFTVFAYVVTRGGDHGHPVAGAAYREYWLADYSRWMRHRVASRWPKISRCLLRNHMCSGLASGAYTTQAAFNSHQLSYIESGCCKPPSSCGYTFVTATDWVNPLTPSNDRDCVRWSNDQSQLCYNCDSCKAGVIRTVNNDWRKSAKISVAVLVVTFLVLPLSFMGGSLRRRPSATATATSGK